jgi:hypothetical protein
MYLPFNIVNFHFDKTGILEWVILDNTYYNNPDPLIKGEVIKIHRLWTKEYYQDFEIITDEVCELA